MNFTPLQTSEVTSAAKLIRSGLVYYGGFTAYVNVESVWNAVKRPTASSLRTICPAPSKVTALWARVWRVHPW